MYVQYYTPVSRNSHVARQPEYSDKDVTTHPRDFDMMF